MNSADRAIPLKKEEVKNLFLVNTEYHLMLSVQIIKLSYSGKHFKNTILCSKSPTRFANTTFGIIENIDIKGIIHPLEKNGVESIINWGCSNFFYFHNYDIVKRWISWQLKKKGCAIYYVQDGLAAYLQLKTKIKFLVSIRDTIRDYIILWKKGLTINKLFFTYSDRYGGNPVIDKLFLTNPEMFDKKQNKFYKEIVKIPSIDSHTLGLLKSIFKNHQGYQTCKIVLHINQPLWSEALIEREISFLVKVKKQFPDRPFYIKLHPNTSEYHKKKYGGIAGAYILTTNLPAEVIIQEISESIILAVCSTALFHYNPANKYYYFLPVFKGINDRILKVQQITVFEHIALIDSVLSIA